MRRLLLATLALIVSAAGASADDFIRYYPPKSSAEAGAGVLDPGGNGIMVRTANNTSVARSFTSSTFVCSNEDGVAGNITCDIDRAVVPDFSSGTSTVAGNCTVGSFYFETDANLISGCSATNTWRTFFSTSDNIPVANLNSGTAASATTFWRGDGSWATPASGEIDAATTIDLTDDFVTGNNTSGTIGRLGWFGIAIASGTLSAGGSANHPGAARFNSHVSNDNSGWRLTLGNGATEGTWGTATFQTGEEWSMDWLVQPGSNSTAITNTAIYVGWATSGQSTPANVTNAIWFRHDSDLADSAWQIAVCNASGANGCGSAASAANAVVVASTITPVAGTWYRLRMRYLIAGVGGNPTVYARVNNETEKTFCSSGCDGTLGTVPASNAAMSPLMIYITQTTTGVMSADLDYFHIHVTGLSRY